MLVRLIFKRKGLGKNVRAAIGVVLISSLLLVNWPLVPFLHFLPGIREVNAAQFGRPDGTVSAGSWTAVGAATLHEATDEVTANDDTDYADAAGVNTTAELSLSNVTDPVSSTGHIVRWRYKPAGSAAAERIVVDLYQGTTLIRTSGNVTGTRGVYNDASFTLTATEADSITDYTDLRLKINTTNLGASESMRVTWLELEVPDAQPNVDQLRYRWRNDDGAEDAGTALVDENTLYSGLEKNTNIRLRFQVKNTGGGAATSYNYRLEWAARVGASCDTDESYAAVPDTATTEHFEMTLTGNYTDQTNSTNVTTGAGVLTNPSGTFVAGKLVEETSNQTNAITLTNEQYTEVEYNFIANNNATDSGNYCFRLTNAGTALNAYTVYAALALAAAAGPTTDQCMRHCNWFNGGTEQGFFWAD